MPLSLPHPDDLNPLSPGFDPRNAAWSALSGEDAMALMRLAQQEKIDKFGYTITGVFPVEEDGYHFAYSMGDEVSVICTGISAEAQIIIDLAHAKLREKHRIGVAWEINDSYQMVFAPVPREAFLEHCTGASSRGAEYAVQVIWQDSQHRWPWDDGYASGTIAPVFAGYSWRPTA